MRTWLSVLLWGNVFFFGAKIGEAWSNGGPAVGCVVVNALAIGSLLTTLIAGRIVEDMRRGDTS